MQHAANTSTVKEYKDFNDNGSLVCEWIYSKRLVHIQLKMSKSSSICDDYEIEIGNIVSVTSHVTLIQLKYLPD